MSNINPLYHNAFGVAFQWKRCPEKKMYKVQLVFRDTGLQLSYEELQWFEKTISATIAHAPSCEHCDQEEGCRGLLLETPLHQVSFAMSLKELKAIKELVEGTLFQLRLNNLLKNI
ncbi:MAG: hypothetical protein AAF717_19530 [Bacteroidota bacterium]